MSYSSWFLAVQALRGIGFGFAGIARNKIGAAVLAVLGLISLVFPVAQASSGIGASKTSTAGMTLAVVAKLPMEPLHARAEAVAALEKWLKAMARCESTNNPLAVNEVDLDGTPSYGLYQFKTGTFRHYVQKYNLFGWQDWAPAEWRKAIWNGEYQEMLVRQMVRDDDVDLRHEFPGCTRKLGLPPQGQPLATSMKL